MSKYVRMPSCIQLRNKRFKTKVFVDKKLVENRISLFVNFNNYSQKRLTLQKLRDSTQNTVNDITLLKNANLMMMLDIDADLIPQLYSAAMKLGHALDLKSEKAIESLGRGLARQSRLVLDNIGVLFKVRDAEQWYKTTYPDDKNPDARDIWIAYAIDRIIEQSKSLVLNQAKVEREQYYAAVGNAKAGV